MTDVVRQLAIGVGLALVLVTVVLFAFLPVKEDCYGSGAQNSGKRTLVDRVEANWNHLGGNCVDRDEPKPGRELEEPSNNTDEEQGPVNRTDEELECVESGGRLDPAYGTLPVPGGRRSMTCTVHNESIRQYLTAESATLVDASAWVSGSAG